MRKIVDLEELAELLRKENPGWAPGMEEVLVDMVREGFTEAWVDENGETYMSVDEGDLDVLR